MMERLQVDGVEREGRESELEGRAQTGGRAQQEWVGLCWWESAR